MSLNDLYKTRNELLNERARKRFSNSRSEYLNELESEISSNPPPRKIGWRPFAQARKAWVKALFFNLLYLVLFGLFLYWTIPFWASSYGVAAKGIVLQKETSKRGGWLTLRFMDRKGVFHQAEIAVESGLFNNVAVGSVLDLHYVEWLPFRPSLDNDPTPQILIEPLAPFIALFFLGLYSFLGFSFFKEYKLFQIGVVVHGKITEMDFGSRSITATVEFSFEGKDYKKKDSYFGYVDEPVLILINPLHPSVHKICFQRRRSLFQVKA